MIKRAAVPIAVLALALPCLAVAAKPRLPATFAGGGQGSPVEFKLNRKGRVTAASFAYTCRNVDGIGVARTDRKRRPSGKVSHGKITITYLAKGGGKVGTVRATINATFTSKTHAKGTTSVSGGNCERPPKGRFTADRQ